MSYNPVQIGDTGQIAADKINGMFFELYDRQILNKFDCTVGQGGDFETIFDAVAAGKRRPLVISDIVENKGEWSLNQDETLYIFGHNKEQITFETEIFSNGDKKQIIFENLKLRFSKALSYFKGAKIIVLNSIIYGGETETPIINTYYTLILKNTEIYTQAYGLEMYILFLEDCSIIGEIDGGTLTIRLEKSFINGLTLSGTFNGTIIPQAANNSTLINVNGENIISGGKFFLFSNNILQNCQGIDFESHSFNSVYKSNIGGSSYGSNEYYEDTSLSNFKYNEIRQSNSIFNRVNFDNSVYKTYTDENKFLNCEFSSGLLVYGDYNQFKNSKFSLGGLWLYGNNSIVENMILENGDIRVLGENNTIKNCILKNGTIIIEDTADKTICEANRTTTEIQDLGTNTMLSHNTTI